MDETMYVYVYETTPLAKCTWFIPLEAESFVNKNLPRQSAGLNDRVLRINSWREKKHD